MSQLLNLTSIEIGTDKQKEEIIKNILKMLIAREYIDEKNLNKYLNEILTQLTSSITCSFSIDHPNDKIGKSCILVLLLEQKISTTTKTSVIGDYLYKKKSDHEIIIVEEITPRAWQTIKHDFPFVEIFLKKEMMFNLIDSIYVPKHILLSHEESEQFMKEYDLRKPEGARIFLSDPVSRYYNAELDQVFRIERPSETSGVVNYYRLVVRDSSLGKKQK